MQNERKIMRKSIIKKVFAKATLLITLITATLQKTRFWYKADFINYITMVRWPTNAYKKCVDPVGEVWEILEVREFLVLKSLQEKQRRKEGEYLSLE